MTSSNDTSNTPTKTTTSNSQSKGLSSIKASCILLANAKLGVLVFTSAMFDIDVF